MRICRATFLPSPGSSGDRKTLAILELNALSASGSKAMANIMKWIDSFEGADQ